MREENWFNYSLLLPLKVNFAKRSYFPFKWQTLESRTSRDILNYSVFVTIYFACVSMLHWNVLKCIFRRQYEDAISNWIRVYESSVVTVKRRLDFERRRIRPNCNWFVLELRLRGKGPFFIDNYHRLCVKVLIDILE